MTPLAQELARLIRDEGPLSVSRYMALCLGHPRHGYYMKQDPFGAAGDFTTAPEISQVFGELIGLWAATVWRMMGEPAALRLVELGPGRGTLMQDVLRAARIVRGFREALSVHLVETSPVLRARQAETLGAAGVTPVWHDRVEDALEGPAIVLANEFLDALPLDQFVLTPEGWRERLVGLNGEGQLAFGLSAEPAGEIARATPPGAVLEQPLAALETVATVARHVAARGGAALFIDYGSMRSGFGDTLQAMRRHGFVDALAEPGDADLTVHVDFARMAQAARAAGAAVHGPATQRDFLLALGLEQRTAALSRRATPEQAQTLAEGANRLVETGSATAMGELFKVLALAEPGLPLLPGFDLHRLSEQSEP
ncbi:class I SAM-dependent methyltransferase [Bosea sp. (in: a-proteobacteria)]|uniref:class I SAM-dependent methyltransferase n=1 Tax=Bosea sp. (in: a-proteobacteria) TaxID=1871050 RepID=UPI002FCC77DD